MKKVLLILVCLFLAFLATGQTLRKKDFVNTEWFSNNLDSLFYKTDTVKLIKYSNIAPKNRGFHGYAESEFKFLKHGYYIQLQFNKAGSMDFWDIKYEMAATYYKGATTWTFDNNENVLLIFRFGKLEFKLKPILVKEVELESKYADTNSQIKTIEVIMLKNK